MQKSYSIILLVMLISGGFMLYRIHKKQVVQPGTIILMNGPSAAGKSSLQKEVQKQFDEFYIKLGIDNLFDSPLPTPESVDPQVTKDGQLIRSVEIIKDEQGNQIIPLKVGPAGFKVIKGMHRAIAAYAQQGNNVVVDYILYDQTWLPDLLKALKGLKVYMVGIKLPLEVLEQREKARGTSPIGHARSHYATVHNTMQYDIELDTSKLSSEEAAFKLKEFMKNNAEPTAFIELGYTGLTPQELQAMRQRDLDDTRKGALARVTAAG